MIFGRVAHSILLALFASLLASCDVIEATTHPMLVKTKGAGEIFPKEIYTGVHLINIRPQFSYVNYNYIIDKNELRVSIGRFREIAMIGTCSQHKKQDNRRELFYTNVSLVHTFISSYGVSDFSNHKLEFIIITPTEGECRMLSDEELDNIRGETTADHNPSKIPED